VIKKVSGEFCKDKRQKTKDKRNKTQAQRPKTKEGSKERSDEVPLQRKGDRSEAEIPLQRKGAGGVSTCDPRPKTKDQR